MVFVRVAVRDEKDHRSGPKTRTGPDSGPSPRPKKIEKKTRTGPDNPEKTDGLGPDQIGPDRTENRRFLTIFVSYFDIL